MTMQTSTIEPISDEYCIVLCTCPTSECAESIALSLVENKLAACVNIVPGLTSVYQWQDKVEKSSELLLMIKTKHSAFQEIKSTILELHSYELPEIISIPFSNGLAKYLSWIDDNVVSIS